MASKMTVVSDPTKGLTVDAVGAVSTSVGIKERRRVWHRGFRSKTPVSKDRAKTSALIVRSLIVGPPSVTAPKVTKVEGKPQLNQIKSHLIEPKSANRVIAELRTLPISEGQEVRTHPSDGSGHKHAIGTSGPIHAVCLEHTEAEEDRIHFSKLADTSAFAAATSSSGAGQSSIEVLTSLMNEMRVVDLIKSPDLGIGQPGNGPGLLAGALPTAETVIKGFEQITPQLMSLGYVTGKAITVDHSGIYPPTDRLSVLTYWWGLELLLPPPSLAYLSNAQSISGAIMNFLTALSLVNNGVREILPMVRYISQYIDFEFNQIKQEDRGKGVVCAATWIMPAALVPRPWDFPDPPILSINPPKDEHDPSRPARPTDPKQAPLPSNGMPFLNPKPLPSMLDAVVAADTPPNPKKTKTK